MKKLGIGLVILSLCAGLFGWTAAEAAGPTTCTGGAIAPGTYTSLLIKGACYIPPGTVSVTKSVEIAPNASLYAATFGSTLTVGGNIEVEKNAVLVLGCSADFGCSTPTTDHVTGSINAHQATAVILHADSIGGNVNITGGGGGVTCNPNPAVEAVLGPGAPAFDAVEDNSIGGSVTVTEVNSCWEGIIRNSVSGNVIVRVNDFAEMNADAIAANSIGKNLLCAGNAPAPNNLEGANTVNGHELGQCVGL